MTTKSKSKATPKSGHGKPTRITDAEYVMREVRRAVRKLLDDDPDIGEEIVADGRRAPSIYLPMQILFDFDQLILIFGSKHLHIAFLPDDEELASPHLTIEYRDRNFVDILFAAIVAFLPYWPPDQSVVTRVRNAMTRLPRSRRKRS